MRSTLLVALAFVGLLSFAAVPLSVHAADWAVIVAGSNGYDNYRHQADACHAYQLVHKNGIPADNIITFMVDDIASAPTNPFPGQIFNVATDKGTPGVDVYKNIQKNYVGRDQVTPENFLAVITGNASATSEPGLPVLQSTADDRVFLYFSDHGGSGLIAFPGEYLYATDLIAALKQMHDTKMYKRLVFYIEACEAGSMFDGLLDPAWNIYATTASNPAESSWGTFCPPDDTVDGVELNSCLGDLYSVNWIQNSESAGVSESLEAQYLIVQNLTDQSHVMQYGSQSFTAEATGDFIGEGPRQGLSLEEAAEEQDEIAQGAKPRSHVSSRDTQMHLAYYRYLRAPLMSDASTEALAALRASLDSREDAINRFLALSKLLMLNREGEVIHQPEHLFRTPVAPVHSRLCVKSAVAALKAGGCDYDDFSLQFHKVIVNACGQHSTEESGAEFVVKAIEQVCPPQQ